MLRRNLLMALAGIALATGAAQGQETPEQGDVVVGPPQLREFQLPGTKTTPAPEQPVQPPAEPPPSEAGQPQATEPPPPASEASPESRVSTPARPVATSERVERRTSDVLPTPSTRSGGSSAQPATVPPTDTLAPPASNSPSAPALPWPWLIAAVLLLGGAAVAVWKFRTAGQQLVAEKDEYREDLGAELLAQPEAPAQPALQQLARTPVGAQRQPATAPVAAGPAMPGEAPAASGDVVGIQLRPWLNLEFKPAQAAATLTEAVVQFELLVTNVGNTIARNIRIEAQMFNAGADQDRQIADFYARPLDEKRSSRILAIPPRSAARLRSSVAMPKENVREINVEGRRLFIPMVAINVVYEWSQGRSGQTSMSYLVGREPEKPSTKMGAFRLDLGPRIYRSVGQRPSQVAVLV